MSTQIPTGSDRDNDRLPRALHDALRELPPSACFAAFVLWHNAGRWFSAADLADYTCMSPQTAHNALQYLREDTELLEVSQRAEHPHARTHAIPDGD